MNTGKPFSHVSAIFRKSTSKDAETKRTHCYSVALFLVCFALLSLNNVYGQFIPPTVPETAIDPGFFGGNPNCAVIDYTLNCGACSGGPYQLTAVAYDYGTPASHGLYVNDGFSTAYGFLGTSGTNYPDVCLANDLTNPNNYLAAVVTNWYGYVYLSIFSITNTGAGLTVTGLQTHHVNVGSTATGAPHIDVEAQWSNLLGGYPTCDNIVISWTTSGGSTSNLNFWAGSLKQIILNNPTSPLVATTIGTSGSLPATPSHIFFDADVAAVERLNPVTGLFEDWALVTVLRSPAITIPYADELDYFEFNVNTPFTPTIQTLDNGDLITPRIDAIDNFKFNYPSVSGADAYYTVVATGHSATLPSGAGLYEYNNIAPVTDVIASLPLPNPGPLNATVACGPTSVLPSFSSGVYNYTIDFWNWYAPYNTLLATQTDWSSGIMATHQYCGVPLSPVNYNWSNYTSNAIASTCNNDGSDPALGLQYAYACWDDGTGHLWGKFANNTPFGFKHAPSSVNYLMSSAGKWKASPNPANDYVRLTSPGTMDKNGNYSYIITDVTGRKLAESPIIQTEEYIDISKLSQGMYLLHVFEAEHELQTLKVVKD